MWIFSLLVISNPDSNQLLHTIMLIFNLLTIPNSAIARLTPIDKAFLAIARVRVVWRRDGADIMIRLESVQQSHFGSQFAFWNFHLQIEMQIGAYVRRTVIPHLKLILNTSKWEIEPFSECSTIRLILKRYFRHQRVCLSCLR